MLVSFSSFSEGVSLFMTSAASMEVVWEFRARHISSSLRGIPEEVRRKKGECDGSVVALQPSQRSFSAELAKNPQERDDPMARTRNEEFKATRFAAISTQLLL
jgi:hypothetical protein